MNDSHCLEPSPSSQQEAHPSDILKRARVNSTGLAARQIHLLPTWSRDRPRYLQRTVTIAGGVGLVGEYAAPTTTILLDVPPCNFLPLRYFCPLSFLIFCSPPHSTNHTPTLCILLHSAHPVHTLTLLRLRAWEMTTNQENSEQQTQHHSHKEKNRTVEVGIDINTERPSTGVSARREPIQGHNHKIN